MKIIVWGTGSDCGKIEFDPDIEIIAYIDSDKRKLEKNFRGVRVIAPNKLMDYEGEYDYILIGSSKYENEIYDNLMQIGILKNKILPMGVIFNPIDLYYQQMFKKLIESDEIQLMENWSIKNGQKRILLKVNNPLYKDVIIEVFPYRGLSADKKCVKLWIKDIEDEEVIYSGNVSAGELIDISKKKSRLFLEIGVDSIDAPYLIVREKNSFYSLELEKIIIEDLRNSLLSQLHMHETQRYHEKDYAFLENYPSLQTGCILDVGGNVGQSAISFLEITDRRVYSFEPHPLFIDAIKFVSKFCNAEDRHYIVNKGVGEKRDVLSFYIPKCEKNRTQEASFSKERAIRRCMELFPNQEIDETYIMEKKIEVISIDDFMSQTGEKVAFAKIDAECYESQIIRGMINTIIKDKPILLLEFNSDEQVVNILNYINKYTNYVLRYWDNDERKFTISNSHNSINYFLIPF